MIERFLEEFVRMTEEHLGDNLCGIYLHGSLAMGCYQLTKSDVDLLIVIRDSMHKGDKRQLILNYMKLEEKYPQIRIEMSIVSEQAIRQFSHPTPFVLHYSLAHKHRYLEDPDYLCENGLDADLAAHFTVIQKRGISLSGEPVGELFQLIPKEAYVDSILSDFEDAKDGAADQPVYYVLNGCRVLLYLEEEVVSSKKEAGEWALKRLPHYEALLSMALHVYAGQMEASFIDLEKVQCFLTEIQSLIHKATVGSEE